MGVHGAEAGWLGERAVDQALIYATGGRIVPWMPVVDAHGIDRAYSWLGIGAPTLVQIKTAAVLGSEGNYEWTMRVDALHRHHRFFVVLVGLPRAPWEEPSFWCVSGGTLAKLASEVFDRRKRAELYVIQGSPARSDRLARYRCSAHELWQRLFPDEKLSARMPFGFPVLHVEQGGVYELATTTDVMIRNRKDLLVFRPAFDVHGRDLLVLLVGTPYAIYLQIKGTALVRDHDRAQFLIRPQTFVPSDDFWFVFRLGIRNKDQLFPEAWLICSRDVDRRTAYQRKLTSRVVEVHIDPARDPLRDYRYAASEIADVIRGALRELRQAA